ncbi:MAG: hypothetical protein H0U53_08380 [Actinobacteria bacterium]|nr:hypothetical protein [Actinomycetota bacterium]
MWDRANLSNALDAAGFRDVQVLDWRTSRVPGWSDLGLDIGHDGREYKPESLYLEGLRV